MNIETLKVFCDIVRFHSFSRAAQENGISQSAASQSLVQIEKTLGAVLIDRKTRPFQLTAEGNAYYNGVKDLVVRYFAVENEVRNLKGEIRGDVRVAAIYSVGLAEISSSIQQFTWNYPGTNVKLAFLHPDRVYESVLNDEADIGLISWPEKRREIESVVWKTEPLVIIAAPGQLQAHDGKIQKDDLMGQRFVGYDKNLLIQKEIERYLSRNDIVVDTVMSFDNIETIKRAVEIGGGFSLVPEPLVRNEVRLGSLEAFDLPGSGINRPVGIIFRKNRPLLRATEVFMELLQEQSRTSKSVRKAA
ncbi:MAG: LysR family transcriptional regulator [Bdellovibrionota bacterium]